MGKEHSLVMDEVRIRYIGNSKRSYVFEVSHTSMVHREEAHAYSIQKKKIPF